jgi:flavin-dependent dehydrogenase
MVEVLIAGAGPAGAVAAIALARAGVRVLLVDRARFPRHKLCGDTVNPGALTLLERVGIRSRVEAASVPLEGMLLTNGLGHWVRGTYGGGAVGRSITRHVLDTMLVEAAVAAGAQFQEGVTVRAPIVSDGRRGPQVRGVVVRGRDARPLRIPAAVTIAADGRRSTLAFGLGLARQPAWPRRWAAGAYYEGVTALGTFGEMHIRDDYYLGVAPVPGGVTNMCVVAPASAAFRDPGAFVDRCVGGDPLLRDRFARARRVSPLTLLGPLAVETGPAGMPGLLLAGDAAGFVDPMTGDGLRLAMRGAELAADVALACLERPDIEGHVLLSRRRRRKLGVKIQVNRVLRRITLSPRAVRLAGLTTCVAPAILEQVIRYAGDVGTC